MPRFLMVHCVDGLVAADNTVHNFGELK